MHTSEQEGTTAATRGPLQRRANKLADDLKNLSDAILWKNHKATEELKDAVKIIAAELLRTADTIKASGPALATLKDEATVHGHLALLEARDKLALLEDLAKRALAGASHSPSFIGETARLKLALSRMEAADLFEEKRRALIEERRRLEVTTDATLRELDKRLGELRDAVMHKK
jgi:hypothetical protein